MKDNVINTSKLKLINQNKVYSYIYNNKSVKKEMIVENINMCLSTVNQNIKQLENLNLIKKDGTFESTGGRKAFSIQINESFRFSIGISLMKNFINIVLVNLYGEVIYKQRYELAFIDEDNYYKELSNNLNKFIKENKIDNKLILGVSIATQGVVINNEITYGNIMHNETMKIENFSKYIKYDLNLEHDSKCAASLALWTTSINTGYVFLLNNNMGSAAIINSEILPGYSGTIEHFNVNSNTSCYCGKEGCLETICSINSIEKNSNMLIDDFFISLRAKDENCINNFNEIINTLAYTINNISHVINGDIILSGKLANYLINEDIELLRNKINEKNIFNTNNKILLCTTGEYTQAIGASLHYIKQFLNTMK